MGAARTLVILADEWLADTVVTEHERHHQVQTIIDALCESIRSPFSLAYRAAGRLNDAIPLFEETLATREELLGPNHPHTLTSRNNLAAAYYAAGRLNDAIPLFEETLTAQTQLLGPDHPDTLRSRNNLAVACAAAGKPFRSEEQPGTSA